MKFQEMCDFPWISMHLVIHDDGSRGVGFTPAYACLSVCLPVCLNAYKHDISKTDGARITKLDTDMLNHESWKQKVTRHKNSAVMGTPVSAGFF